jgi:hypothetical protein
MAQRAADADTELTGWLAELVLGWKSAPGHFLKSSRSWTPKWRFDPFARLGDAFLLLDRSGGTYSVCSLKRKFAQGCHHRCATLSRSRSFIPCGAESLKKETNYVE